MTTSELSTAPAADLKADPEADSTAGGEAIPAIVERLRATFRTGRTRPYAWRVEQLTALERMLTEREDDFVVALGEDLGRPALDAWMADIAPTVSESEYARKRLKRWMRKQRVGVPLSVQPGRAWYQYEPLGVVLIIGPWNYPAYLTLTPLVAAIAAGNCAILKPSEHTPATSALLARLVPQYLDASAVAVVEGAAEATQSLIDQALDHVFFTGGPEIGKAVMAGAAKHLTPVTLELGGKSPVIVASDADLPVAARRIAFTKLMNSGQTCIAPDYVLVDRTVRDAFLTELDTAFDAMRAGESDLMPIVNSRQASRLARLIAGTGGRTARGGTVDEAGHRAEVTVVVDPDDDSALMSEEIFGPILPVVSFDTMDAAIKRVVDGPKPLAVYLFSASRAIQRRILDEVSNGGTVINHLLFHVMVPGLPFGGVGNSGMGAYHGKWGFDTFSHRKAVLSKRIKPDLSMMYPPYSEKTKKMMRKIF
ncbi:MAG: aldehyde dehydrogenase family protein [Jatrophihabitantaceae bacterium]